MYECILCCSRLCQVRLGYSGAQRKLITFMYVCMYYVCVVLDCVAEARWQGSSEEGPGHHRRQPRRSQVSHTYIHTYIHTVHAYIQYMHITYTTYRQTDIYIHMYSTYAYIHAYIHTYIHTYIHLRSYIYIHIHTYTRTYIHTLPYDE